MCEALPGRRPHPFGDPLSLHEKGRDPSHFIVVETTLQHVHRGFSKLLTHLGNFEKPINGSAQTIQFRILRDRLALLDSSNNLRLLSIEAYLQSI